MFKEKENNIKLKGEAFRLYYQIQFDRIDKLETKRENFCNFVLTLSSVIIAFSLSVDNRLPKYTNVIIILILLINLAAIIFIRKTRPFIKMHQKRAEVACRANKKANAFYLINKEVGKVNSNDDIFNRSNLYTYLHFGIIFLMIIVLIIENFCIC